MQDRFKFRAFLKDKRNASTPFIKNNVFDVHSIGFDSNNLPETVILIGHHKNGDFAIHEFNAHDVELLQCTSIKDKNSRLMYEGDVVKYTDEVYDCCIGKIEWDNAHYELQYYTGEKYGWFSHILCLKYIENIEVIGNIYENPELLEGKND